MVTRYTIVTIRSICRCVIFNTDLTLSRVTRGPRRFLVLKMTNDKGTNYSCGTKIPQLEPGDQNRTIVILDDQNLTIGPNGLISHNRDSWGIKNATKHCFFLARSGGEKRRLLHITGNELRGGYHATRWRTGKRAPPKLQNEISLGAFHFVDIRMLINIHLGTTFFAPFTSNWFSLRVSGDK